MATLPTSSIELAPGVTIVTQPSVTWNIDRETNRIRGEADGLDAVKQAVDIILHTERFRWQIYSPYSGMEWDGLIGQDPGYVAAALQRRIRGALLMDDRIRGVTGYEYKMDGSRLHASLTVETVYGDFQTNVEVETA